MKKRLVDIVLILIMMVASILVRYRIFDLNGVKDIYKEDFKYETGTMYMNDTDSYLYLRRIDNFVNEDNYLIKPYLHDKYGPGDEDSISEINFLPISISYLYRIFSIFSNISLYDFVFYVTPLLFSLSVIPIYFFLKHKTNRLGAFIGGLLIGVNVPYYACTQFGTIDTDVYLCLLPLLYICSFIELLDTDKPKKYYILSTIGFLLLLSTWNVGSWAYYYLEVALVFLITFISLIKNKFKITKVIKLPEVKRGFISILLCTLVALIVKGGINLMPFNVIINYLKGDTFFNYAYPDPSRYVSELQEVPIIGIKIFDITNYGIINYLGGILNILVVLLTVIFMFYKIIKYFKNNKNKNEYLVMLSLLVWLIGGLVSLIAGVRFLKILIIPFILVLGLGIGYFYKYMDKKNYSITCIGIVIILIALPSLKVYKLADSLSPVIDDAFYDTTVFIRDNTPSDSIVLSWWDFGYYYQYEAKRKTMLDGGTFDGRTYLFVGKAFCTTNSNLSKNIFNMIALNRIKASEYIDTLVGNSKDGTNLLLRLLENNKEEAIKYLNENTSFKETEKEKLINLAYPETNRDVIVVITKDMFDKLGVIGYYGLYDFTEEDYKVVIDKDAMIYKLNDVNYTNNNFELLNVVEDKANLFTSRTWKISN